MQAVITVAFERDDEIGLHETSDAGRAFHEREVVGPRLPVLAVHGRRRTAQALSVGSNGDEKNEGCRQGRHQLHFAPTILKLAGLEPPNP